MLGTLKHMLGKQNIRETKTYIRKTGETKCWGSKNIKYLGNKNINVGKTKTFVGENKNICWEIKYWKTKIKIFKKK